MFSDTSNFKILTVKDDSVKEYPRGFDDLSMNFPDADSNSFGQLAGNKYKYRENQ